MGRRIARLATAGVGVGTLVLAGLTAAGPVGQAAAGEPTVHFTAAGDYAASTNAQAVLARSTRTSTSCSGISRTA